MVPSSRTTALRNLHEIADICYVQFDRRPSHNTVKQVLADGPSPSRTTRHNGSVFRAKQAMAIYEALDIQKEWIHKKQSWENMIETHFNIMRRMSNYHFEQVTS